MRNPITGVKHHRKSDSEAELHAIKLALDRQTRSAAKWAFIHAHILAEGLAAIALAASTPEDNSADVNEQILKLKASTDQLRAAVEANQPDE